MGAAEWMQARSPEQSLTARIVRWYSFLSATLVGG
uniref:Uncharacterized protein n=1 Tax=Arundo donax TaxID=35708 RepID=A0A0A9EBU3_ARUDO